MYELKNEYVTFRIGEDFKINFLSNNKINPDYNYIQKDMQSFWKIIFKQGENWENVVDPKEQTYRVEQSEQSLMFLIDKLVYQGKELDINIKFQFRLSDDDIICNSSISNKSDGEVTELLFPRLGGLYGIGVEEHKEDLIWPNCAGRRIRNLQDRKENFEELYPWPVSMQWFELTNEQGGIYMGSHDDSFGVTALKAECARSEEKGFLFELIKYPFVNKDESWDSCDFIISAHCGDWQVGADKYKEWAKTWKVKVEKPNWVKNMKGMLLVIFKQQYGDIMWKYSELPYLLEWAKSNGMDTLGMFGWTEGGHDNKYPVFEPNPNMGGGEELRKGLKAVEEAGGNTIMYCQGLLLDVSHPFYKEGDGWEIAAKTMWNTPYYQEYNKFYHSNLLKHFNNKGFALACPSAPKWIDRMGEEGVKYVGYGTNGILYDQIGGHGSYL